MRAAIDAGGRAFVLREKDLGREERRNLARACLAVTSAAGATLAIASDVGLAADLGGLPVHLAARDPRPRDATWWGRSCHGEQELRAALEEGAAYATVSPVFSSTAKPGYGPALGEDGLRTLVHAAGELPVYALGGVTEERCAACMQAGAAGVAVMSAVMAASDPAQAVARLLERLEIAHPRRLPG